MEIRNGRSWRATPVSMYRNAPRSTWHVTTFHASRPTSDEPREREPERSTLHGKPERTSAHAGAGAGERRAAAGERERVDGASDLDCDRDTVPALVILFFFFFFFFRGLWPRLFAFAALRKSTDLFTLLRLCAKTRLLRFCGFAQKHAFCFFGFAKKPFLHAFGSSPKAQNSARRRVAPAAQDYWICRSTVLEMLATPEGAEACRVTYAV